MKSLARTWYRTDVTDDDPDYVGAFTEPIPDAVAAAIVAVDWSKRGEVEVTYVMDGAAYDPDRRP